MAYRWRNLTAYCVADRSVVTLPEFVLVGLAPFVVSNSLLIVVIIGVGRFWPVLWGMPWLHVGACSGDFAFVHYWDWHSFLVAPGPP